MPHGRTTKNENHSPFERGCRGMSCGEHGTGKPKDTPLRPPEGVKELSCNVDLSCPLTPVPTPVPSPPMGARGKK